MDRNLIINEIKECIDKGNDVINTKWNVQNGIGFPTYVDYSLYQNWFTKIKLLLGKCLETNDEFYCKICSLPESTLANTKTIIKILNSILEYEEKGILSFVDSNNTNFSISTLYNVLNHFNDIVKQLRKRYNGRATLDVTDEYDVQDLMHSLLKIFYDDIRKEEWTPSYAGKCSRQDFLIKKEHCVIEVKMTRSGLTEKDLGDQLLIDIARYKTHPDCKSLICFIFDPDGRVSNPVGFIDDIEKANENFVKVVINPI